MFFFLILTELTKMFWAMSGTNSCVLTGVFCVMTLASVFCVMILTGVFCGLTLTGCVLTWIGGFWQ